ncbi:MAG: TolC family protein [Gammaproteobacteria bacterium]|nr:TolC family protein [Gammaproteobacteria bacterium]
MKALKLWPTYIFSTLLSTLLTLLSMQGLYADEVIPKLSLTDAIFLGIRENPTVQNARTSLTLQKFSVWVQRWQFLPHYALTANAGVGKTRSAWQIVQPTSNLNVSPTVTWTSPIGTQVTLNATNAKGKHYNPGVSLAILQPLIRGFGKAITEASLYNAQDSELVSRLNLEGTLRSTVTAIINAYLDVVTAEQTVAIDQKALKRAEESVTQTKIFIDSGRKAGNELITVEANVASAKTQLENDKNNLVQSRYALLTAIGIDPNTMIQFIPLNIQQLIQKYHYPTLTDTKELVLLNDIQYQTEKLTLEGTTTRTLIKAEDDTRWQLDLDIKAGSGSGQAGGFQAGTNSVFNGSNWNQSAGLTLQIPIDNQLTKQALLGAQIGLKQAKLGLQQTKWSKETGAINGWNLVAAAKRALAFAEDAERLQEQTYQVSYQKYLHGLIDSLELQTAQDALTRSQQTLLGTRISYLKALVNFDMLIGHTLKTWNIETRI